MDGEPPYTSRPWKPHEEEHARRSESGAPPGDGSSYHITARPFRWREPTTFPCRQWLYGRHLVRRFISCTVAPSGVGKSSLALVEAVAMATGRPLLGVKIAEPLRVWVINLEDPLEELERRVLAILLHFRIHPDELGGRLFLNSGRDTKVMIASTTRAGTVLARPVVDALGAEIIRRRADVVVIDPLVKAHQVPENDNGAIDMVCTALAGIADACGCAFDLVHHVRKTNGAEVAVEDGRGASALLAAARSARALNRMSQAEADSAGVDDPRSYFRAETGKSNLAPPEKADWFRLVSVALGNGDPSAPQDDGDRVGVAELWMWPDALADLTANDLLRVQRAVKDGRWRFDAQSSEWVGKAVAAVLGLDADAKADKARITSLLKTWIVSGALRKVDGLDDKRRTKVFVEVGTLAT